MGAGEAGAGGSKAGEHSGSESRSYWVGMARGFGGAIFFSIPLFMTMEMWWLGFYAGRLKLVLLYALMLPVLVGLSHYSGIRPTAGWIGDAADAVSAYAIGFVASAAVLLLLGVIDFSMSARELVGKVTLQALPASFGAVIAQSELGQRDPEKERRMADVGYAGQLFLMGCGAIYLGLSVAPTQEMVVIAFKMNSANAVALAVFSLLLLHVFVYVLNFRGQEPTPEGTPWWSLFLRFTVVGYALALLVGACVLWAFGRFEGNALTWSLVEATVLGFPATVGAAAARLIL